MAVNATDAMFPDENRRITGLRYRVSASAARIVARLNELDDARESVGVGGFQRTFRFFLSSDNETPLRLENVQGCPRILAFWNFGGRKLI